MDAKAVLTVGGTVVALLQILKATGLEGRWAMVVSALLSALCTVLWIYSFGTFARTVAWDYFAGWVAVFTTAAGVFNIVASTPAQVTNIKGAGSALVGAIKGTGSGGPQP